MSSGAHCKHPQWVNPGNGSGNLPGFTWILPGFYKDSPGFTRTFTRIYQKLPGCYQDFTRINSGAPAMLGGAPRRSAEHRRSAAKHLQLVNPGNDSANLPGFTRISPELLQDSPEFTGIYQMSPGLPGFNQNFTRIYQDFTRILPELLPVFHQNPPEFT